MGSFFLLGSCLPLLLLLQFPSFCDCFVPVPIVVVCTTRRTKSSPSPSSSPSISSSSSASLALNNEIIGNSHNDGDQDRFFVASASRVRLSVNPVEKFWEASSAHLVLVFVPPHMIASALEKHISSNRLASGSSFWISPTSSADNFAQDLIPRIHPTALSGCRIRGIVLTSIAADNRPAEILLLEVPKGKSITDDILRPTSGTVIAGDPNQGVLKILPMTRIEFEFDFTQEQDDSANRIMGQAIGDETNANANANTNTSTNTERNSSCTAGIPSYKIIAPQIPACPVCIHRIDAIRLGLPAPCVHQLCTIYCPSPSLIVDSRGSEEESCHKQRLLNKWSAPARCKACLIIDHYWNYNNSNTGNGEDEEDRDLFCGECSMHNTLWVCLTCGFVGCGRYSNKHSVAHFEQTRHPYSLELATLRIWDYCYGKDGDFVQRADLLECPSSPPLLYPWLTHGLNLDDRNIFGSSRGESHHNNLGGSMYNSNINATLSKAAEKSSKKVAMVGKEYEALLQSALEDQAQHYEDVITRLQAEHTNCLVDKNSMSPEETREIEALKIEIQNAREGIEQVSKELIEAQAQEADLRAASKRLLSEQQESNELLKKIKEEHRRENEDGKLQIEDLQQQIAELSANLTMRQQFSQNNELSNAQIFGTTSAPEARQSAGRKGKKKGRFFRK
mmetsp:Transcript_22546/g.49004  ORF Transcript_22546/g.49004 Transcript_22546/m.49004 type:complete len:676 (+) Transcript_22546:429-2456(+)